MNTVFMKREAVAPYAMLWGRLENSLANARWLQALEQALPTASVAQVLGLLDQGKPFFEWEDFSVVSTSGDGGSAEAEDEN